jgi:hypothetical protein
MIATLLIFQYLDQFFPAHITELFFAFFASGNGQTGAVYFNATEKLAAFGIGPEGNAAKGHFNSFVNFQVSLTSFCHSFLVVVISSKTSEDVHAGFSIGVHSWLSLAFLHFVQ